MDAGGATRPMYSTFDYGQMAADRVRVDAYARAIRGAVRTGSTVLDLGCGTGLFTLLALTAGARHVHAVDTNPAIWLLDELARENGVRERVTIHHASSFEVEVPERVDVVISDLRGGSPLNGDHLAAVRDARARWLSPGGTLVPLCDELRVAMVESDALAGAIGAGYASYGRAGIAAEAARRSVLNAVYDDRRAPLQASHVLSSSGTWGRLDYTSLVPGVVEGTVELTATRAGVAHGLAVWFDAHVADGITFTTAPGWALTYARLYLPLLDPVAVREGDRATVTLRADERGERWAWDTRWLDEGGATRTGARQSTFLGAPTAPSALLRTAATYAPRRTPRGERLARILEAMDGSTSIAEIADRVAATTPDAARTRLLDEVRAAASAYGR